MARGAPVRRTATYGNAQPEKVARPRHPRYARRAVADNALVFIACFSSRSVARKISYQNEEILLAIEQLRVRRPGDLWLIPASSMNAKYRILIWVATGRLRRSSVSTYSAISESQGSPGSRRQ